MIIGLAPMDGFTDCAFRQITKEIFDKYGKKSTIDHGPSTIDLYMRTEFMNADGYIINPIGVIKHLLTDKKQMPVIAQIFGGNEEMLVKCFADIQTKYFFNSEFIIQNSEKIKNIKSSINSAFCTLHSAFSFSGIELNMGCSSRNVMNTGGGSALLKDRKESLRIIKNIRESISMPFSIKTRIGLDEHDRKKQMEFLVEASEFVDMITIHGRTAKQLYAGEVDRNFIYELKKQIEGGRSKVQGPRSSSQIKECRIIGNGGIKSYSDIEKYQGILDGVMIGQAAVGNPRIFTPHIPSRKEIKETILKHLDYMISYENFFQEQMKKFDGTLHMPTSTLLKKSIVPSFNRSYVLISEFRKHLFQYVKGIPGSKEFKQKVSTISEYKPLVEEIQKFFSG